MRLSENIFEYDVFSQRKVSYFLLAGIHLVVLGIAFCVYRVWAGFPLVLGWDELLQFDAHRYLDVRFNGYYYDPERQSTVAFFPGFPLVWRWLGVNSYAISLFNIALFYASIVALSKVYKFSGWLFLLFLSLPPLLFMYVPYSESLFFFAATLILIGLRKEVVWLTVAGLIISCFTRSAGNILIPALLITTLFSRKISVPQFIIYLLAACFGWALALWVQYLDTGQIWGYWQTQQHWNHHLQFPKIPFTTWGAQDDPLNLRLDSASLFLGLSAVALVLVKLWKRLSQQKLITEPEILFSLLYLAGATFFAVAFKGGSLYSLNRYLIPTAFGFLSLAFMLHLLHFRKVWHYGAALIGLTLFFSLMHKFVHIKPVLEFLWLSLYLLLYPLVREKQYWLRIAAFVALYLANITLQIFFISQYLQGKWVA